MGMGNSQENQIPEHLWSGLSLTQQVSHMCHHSAEEAHVDVPTLQTVYG